MGVSIWRYLAVFLNGLWLGGFTIYTAVVLRVGGKIVGGLEQGYITQAVTGKLHWIALVMAMAILLDTTLHRRWVSKKVVRLRWGIGVGMLVVLGFLFPIHAELSSLMDGVGFVKPDPEVFQPLHGRYQSIVTLIWLGAMVDLGLMLHCHRKGE